MYTPAGLGLPTTGGETLGCIANLKFPLKLSGNFRLGEGFEVTLKLQPVKVEPALGLAVKVIESLLPVVSVQALGQAWIVNDVVSLIVTVPPAQWASVPEPLPDRARRGRRLSVAAGALRALESGARWGGTDPETYRRSSHAAYLRRGALTWMAVQTVLEMVRGRAPYRRFIREGYGEGARADLWGQHVWQLETSSCATATRRTTSPT
jgi:hypothetical protein